MAAPLLVLLAGALVRWAPAGAAAEQLQVFGGAAQANDSFSSLLELNHFKLLERDGDSLLVGARNVVYNLSLSTMREQRRLEWPSSEDDIRMCRVKGKSPDQCQNYIRVLKLQAPNTLFVCGTNAYKPRCRTYLVTTTAYELVSETPGEGACPYQENQNVTSLFADGELYSATAAQFSGIDGLIHRSPLRTEQFNPKQLNSPNFVSSFRYREHVYFLFREIAIEHINCGKTIYSRIARVCINDSGGQTRVNRERWTSFVKARLNCSIPGEFPFYFDELQSASGVVSAASGGAGAPSGFEHPNQQQQFSGHHQTAHQDPNQDMLYAVFTTPANSIGGSAICAYRMSDVLAAFEGPFKSQADSQSQWLAVPESRVPQPRPGTCLNDSKRLPDENINFIKENPLMDLAVEPVWSQPLITMASINFRFTQIAVHPQVETEGAQNAPLLRQDVIYVATDDGRVFKLINTRVRSFALHPTAAALQSSLNSNDQRPVVREPLPEVSGFTVVIEELHLFDSRTPILNLLLYNAPPEVGTRNSKLIILSGRQIKAIPLSRCERALTCLDCLALLDPYCAWDMPLQACVPVGRSVSPTGSPLPGSNFRRHHYHQQAATVWFPPNNVNSGSEPPMHLLGAPTNNHTLAWWSHCPAAELSQSQVVGPPFRSLFSSHLQVPSRYDYASGHHLAHTALVALSPPPQLQMTPHEQQQQQQPQAYFRPRNLPPSVSSECMTFCGGMHSSQPMSPIAHRSSAEASAATGVLNCADYVQAHFAAATSGSGTATFAPGNADYRHLLDANGSPSLGFAPSSLYTSENLYYAVIISSVSGLIVGLLFGFALGRNTHRKHTDSSVCSSAFDETNLYMASTGSHQAAAAAAVAAAGNPANLFATHQHRLNQLVSHGSGYGSPAYPSVYTRATNPRLDRDDYTQIGGGQKPV